jgi:hypothetical protein
MRASERRERDRNRTVVIVDAEMASSQSSSFVAAVAVDDVAVLIARIAAV